MEHQSEETQTWSEFRTKMDKLRKVDISHGSNHVFNDMYELI